MHACLRVYKRTVPRLLVLFSIEPISDARTGSETALNTVAQNPGVIGAWAPVSSTNAQQQYEKPCLSTAFFTTVKCAELC